MRTFHYRSGKNAVVALLLTLIGGSACTLWWSDGGVFTIGFGLLCLLGAAKAAADAMSNEPALKFDHRAVWVRKTYGGLQQVPWSEVQGISLQVFTMRQWGVIPIHRTEYITIACNGGLLGTRRLRLTANVIDLPRGGATELVLTLQAAHLDAVGPAGVAMAGAGSRGWGVDPQPASDAAANHGAADGFDPDAAIARYLASKNAAPADLATPGAATPRSMVPQRPVFGRRAG